MQGVLHHLGIRNDAEYHQMIFPIKYQAEVSEMLHGCQGHQGMKQAIAM